MQLTASPHAGKGVGIPFRGSSPTERTTLTGRDSHRKRFSLPSEGSTILNFVQIRMTVAVETFHAVLNPPRIDRGLEQRCHAYELWQFFFSRRIAGFAIFP